MHPCCSIYLYLILFRCWIIIQLFEYTTLIHPFVSWWAFGLFPFFSYDKKFCREHSRTPFCIQVFVWTDIFIYLGYTCRPRSGLARSQRGPWFNRKTNFFEELLNCFPKFCTILPSHQQYVRIPICLHHHQLLLLSIFLIIGHPSGCVISHCGFDLYFSNG